MTRINNTNRKFLKRIAQLPNKDEVEPMLYVSDMYLALKPIIPRPLTAIELRQIIPHTKPMR